ncbi:MAG: carbohydrate ABC transporter permease [Armatimonadota bacterium]|nr:carbohydrate ABC transporter permease [Armatimonadota bacterium]MDR7438374.1 carbohydrate ABC transporter permease [Armatimonadota bacterium]MDR7563360.1 carbohydrate ABC transporter permease [Armatimonadota bacterium]MDR7568816.1 carbohydrate ABC transporter permease [Armatimonadota bacterium]MDR7602418.1 carbohydrate ABC transporter permease [Armatimonadota bacterium]
MGRGLLLWGVLVWVLFPLYWAGITSLKEPTETFRPTLLPFVQFTPTLSNWQDQLRLAGRDILRDLQNSLLVAAASASLALLLGSMAGYALARFRFHIGPLRNHDIATWFLSQVILPPAVVVIPFFLFMQRLGLLDTPLALILAHTTMNLPLATLLMRDTFLGLPVELEEAALVDGASRLRTFVHVVLPLAAPALVSTGLLAFAFSWNEFLYALTLTFERATTIPLLIAGAKMSQGIQFWFVSVRVLLALLPPVLLAFTVQRYVVRGLTLGAVR